MALADVAQGLQDYLKEKRAEDIAAEERERLERERAEDRKLINEARRLNADTRRLNTLSKKVGVIREVGGSASPALIGELEAAGSPERGYFEADAYVPSGTGEAPGHLGQSEFFLRPTAEEQKASEVQGDLFDYIEKSTPDRETRERALALASLGDASGALSLVHAEPETQEYNRILPDGTQHRVRLTPDQVRPYNAETGTGDRLVGGFYPTKQAPPNIFARKEQEMKYQGVVREYMYPSEYNLLNAPETQGGAGGNLDRFREQFPDKAALIDDADAAYGRIAFARQQAQERGETITEEQFLNLLVKPGGKEIDTPIPPEDQEIASLAEQWGAGNYMPDADVASWIERKISQKYQRDTSPLEWKAERDRLLGKLRNAGVVGPDALGRFMEGVGEWWSEEAAKTRAGKTRQETWRLLHTTGVPGVPTGLYNDPFPTDRDPSPEQIREYKRLVAGQGR